MRRPIIAGNWKCHLLSSEAVSLIQSLRKVLDGLEGPEVVVCPTFTSLASVKQALAGSSIGLGAQDLFWELQGAFTGEVSAPMLVDAGCRYVIIGHSERRRFFGETDEMVHRKLQAALTSRLTPIVCIGETLEEREQEQTLEVLRRQLRGALNGPTGGDHFAAKDLAHLVLAYEPVWAIGTGRNATPEQAQEAQHFIREWLSSAFGQPFAESVRIQYGGSVTAANALSLLSQPDVDGALVGGASLKADSFVAIVKASVEAKAVNT